MNYKNITDQWRAYITAIRQAEEYADSHDTNEADADLDFGVPEPCPETNKRQIIAQLREVVGKAIPLPQVRTYQAAGRPEFQKLIYTIEMTDRVFCTGDERYFANIIYDHYNIEHGAQGIYDIIAHFVTWVDADKP